MDRAWAGVDIGKQHHHVVVVNADGDKMFSRRVINDESALLALTEEVSSLTEELVWAIDLHSSEAALLVALLLAHGHRVVYLPGMAVNQAMRTYRDAGKTDAKDAYVIADEARMRRGLTEVRVDEELVVELRMLTATPSMVQPPWRSRSSRPLRVSLTDSISCRTGLSRCWAGSRSAVAIRRAQQPDSAFGEELVEFPGGVAPAGDDQQTGSVVQDGGVGVQDGYQDLAFVDLGVCQCLGDG